MNQAPAAEPMDFSIDETEKFEAWFLRVKPRLMHLASIVGRRSRTEVEEQQQEDLVAHLDKLLEDLSDVALEVKELTIKAKEYYQDWLADETEMFINDNTVLGKGPTKKTAQDYCVKTNSPQKRILERIEAMGATLDTRAIICQSMLKSLKPK